MAISAQEYLNQLKALLPPGVAFPRGDSTSVLALLLEAWAQEFARADARSKALILEADPRKATESFQEWLDQWGLPDACLKAWASPGNSALRKVLLWKIRDASALTPNFFIELGAMFGYKVTIDEFRRHSVVSRVTDVLALQRWPNHWRVNVLSGRGSAVTWHDVTGEAKEPLAWWGDDLIECLLRKCCPAHTILYVGFTSYEEN